MVTRSCPPLPRLTRISRRAKSTSFTRKLNASCSRNPEPHNNKPPTVHRYAVRPASTVPRRATAPPADASERARVRRRANHRRGARVLRDTGTARRLRPASELTVSRRRVRRCALGSRQSPVHSSRVDVDVRDIGYSGESSPSMPALYAGTYVASAGAIERVREALEAVQSYDRPSLVAMRTSLPTRGSAGTAYFIERPISQQVIDRA